jgi:hypothetical protein
MWFGGVALMRSREGQRQLAAALAAEKSTG